MFPLFLFYYCLEFGRSDFYDNKTWKTAFPTISMQVIEKKAVYFYLLFFNFISQTRAPVSKATGSFS